ncbi:MAG: hypothetical protein R3F37_20655 [Candidatus Competibacteraceae bacterium]
MKISQFVLFATFVVVTIFNPAQAASDYDDWWLCANQCAEEDAECIDACTADFNETHNNPYPADLCIQVLADTGFLTSKTGLEKDSRVKGLKIRPDAKGWPSCNNEPGLVARCPAGSVATPFEIQVYDEAGLFVVCYETVSVCIPEDMEPAG